MSMQSIYDYKPNAPQRNERNHWHTMLEKLQDTPIEKKKSFVLSNMLPLMEEPKEWGISIDAWCDPYDDTLIEKYNFFMGRKDQDPYDNIGDFARWARKNNYIAKHKNRHLRNWMEKELHHATAKAIAQASNEPTLGLLELYQSIVDKWSQVSKYPISCAIDRRLIYKRSKHYKEGLQHEAISQIIDDRRAWMQRLTPLERWCVLRQHRLVANQTYGKDRMLNWMLTDYILQHPSHRIDWTNVEKMFQQSTYDTEWMRKTLGDNGVQRSLSSIALAVRWSPKEMERIFHQGPKNIPQRQLVGDMLAFLLEHPQCLLVENVQQRLNALAPQGLSTKQEEMLARAHAVTSLLENLGFHNNATLDAPLSPEYHIMLQSKTVPMASISELPTQDTTEFTS